MTIHNYDGPCGQPWCRLLIPHVHGHVHGAVMLGINWYEESMANTGPVQVEINLFNQIVMSMPNWQLLEVIHRAERTRLESCGSDGCTTTTGLQREFPDGYQALVEEAQRRKLCL